jgi:type I restriction enzyme, S subunit
MDNQVNLPTLPLGWSWSNFLELASDKPHALKAGPFGSALKKEFYVADGYKIYGQEQVIRNNPYYGNYYISSEKFNELKSCAVEPEDILVSLVGTVGKVLVLPHDIQPGIINPRLVKLSLEKKVVFSQYIKKYLESSTTRKYFSMFSHGGTMDILNLKILKSLPIPLPPLNEQRRIVSTIEQLTDRSHKARAALEDVPKLIAQFRQSVLAAAFRGDLTADWREKNPDVEPASELLERIKIDRRKRWEEAELEKMRAQGKEPKDDKWKEKNNPTNQRGARHKVAGINAEKFRLDDIPESWQLVRLSEIIDLQPGYAFKSTWFTTKGIRLLRGTNIVPGGTRWDEVVFLPESEAQKFNEYSLDSGDIVIAMDRPVISSGLKVTVIGNSDLPALLLQRVGRFKIENNIHADYVFHFLNSPLFFSHIQDQATGTQLPHISKNDIESVLIPLPPYSEQLQVIQQLNSVYNQNNYVREFSNQCLTDLEQLDRSILAKAFRGELVPQDPNDEPAAVLLERIRAEREQTSTPKQRGKTTRKNSSKQLSIEGIE